MTELLLRDETFRYQLLGRLQSDCEYYLGYGNRNPKHLWAGNEQEQIQLMKDLHKSFTKDKKPKWLTLKRICRYERTMIKD